MEAKTKEARIAEEKANAEIFRVCAMANIDSAKQLAENGCYGGAINLLLRAVEDLKEVDSSVFFIEED